MTTLSYDLDPADAAVLGALNAIDNIDVHVGRVTDSDDDAHTVSAPLPYLLYASGIGAAASQRVGGWIGRRMGFSVNYVHASHPGAKAVALAVRDYLDGRAVTIDGRERRIRLQDPTADPVIEFDETWTRTDGSSLYFGMDRFWVEAV